MTAIWFGLMLFLGGGDGSDQSGTSTWSRAERAYRSGQYETASALFDGTRSDPTIARGPALYNLGNCAYRLGRYVDAALYYRRALVRMPRDPEVTFNLSLAERQMGIEAPARSLVGSVILRAQQLPPEILLLLAAAIQGMGFFGLMRMGRGRRARVAMVLLVLTGVLGTLGLGYDSLFPGPPVAMVLASEITLRPEPHSSLGITLKLEAGAIVRVEEMSDRWARIIHPRGEGWTERAGLGLVN
jgi:tetratricopeptide (TPR) repeat protein